MTQRWPLALAFVCLAVAVPAAQQPAEPPSITTKGEAVLKKAPDRAWISVATETRDTKANDARTKNAETMTTVQSALRKAGVAADAIRTTGYSLTPDVQWANGRSTVRGYIARNQIDVRVDDLDKLGDVLDAANSGQNTSISVMGPRFDLKNQQAAEAEALQQAVEVAIARAQAIARGARRQVGGILQISEEGTQTIMPPPRPMMLATRAEGYAAQAAPETPITPGEIEVRVTVILKVEIR